MSYYYKIILTTLTSIILLSGCTSDLGRFTYLSTNNVNPKSVNESEYTIAEGSSSHAGLLFIPIGEINANLQHATHNVLQETNGDVMTNANSQEFFLGLWPIFWVSGVKVEGRVHNTTGGKLIPQEDYRNNKQDFGL